MSTLEANWAAGMLVTAEAVNGIGYALDEEPEAEGRQEAESE